MRRLSYKAFGFAARFVGLWVLKAFAWGVSSCYFLFFPKRVGVGVRFYGVLFPDKSVFYHIRSTWKQYHYFAALFVDRMTLHDPAGIRFSSEGIEHLKRASMDRTGGIILMSHLGNWEVAIHLLRGELPDTELLLYMGAKQGEAIERMQKEGLTRAGIRIMAFDRDGGSPFDIVEGLRVLKRGGFVSMTGDVTWHKGQRTLPVRFLGHNVHIPELPYRLAWMSGVPLFVFFSTRSEAADFHFVIHEPIAVTAESSRRKGKVIQEAAQTYAELLERTVIAHPFEWYHFEPFLGSPRGGLSENQF